MPNLRVLVDGVEVAAVCTEDLHVLGASLSGTKIDEAFATLDMHGSRYPAEGESTYLIWLNHPPVEPGQTVRVEVSAPGSNSHAGRTIDELFPDGNEEPEEAALSPEEMLENLGKRPKVRSRYQFSVRSSAGEECTAETSAEDHGFSFSFLWNYHRPERVHASLHTYSLEQLRARSGFTYHWRAQLTEGEWAEVTVEA